MDKLHTPDGLYYYDPLLSAGEVTDRDTSKCMVCRQGQRATMTSSAGMTLRQGAQSHGNWVESINAYVKGLRRVVRSTMMVLVPNHAIFLVIRVE